MSKVNFVILGFPKCGTTSLVDNLNKHSKINVYYSRPWNKESMLFYQEVFNNIEKRQEYNKYLVEGKVNGEKNPTYIWRVYSLLNMKIHNPNMKVIICLRNPVDYLYSWYHQLFLNCNCINCKRRRGEEITHEDLKQDAEKKQKEEAVRLENQKLQDLYHDDDEDDDFEFEESDSEEEKKDEPERCENIPSFQEFYKNERNKEQSYFAKHIKYAKAIFNEENIYYLIQEEYKQDNQKELNKIFKFLGLEEEKIENFSYFEGKRPQGEMSDEIKCFLQEQYKEHNERLFKILGRKIDNWC